MDELRRARDAAAGADIVELRLDGVDRPDVAGALDGRLRPVIVTCRPRWEGGRFDGSEEERRDLLVAALQAGAEFVDVEFRAGFAAELCRLRRGRGLIASLHVFEGQVAKPFEQVRALLATGAEVAKLAVRVNSLTESLELFEAAEAASRAAGEGQGHVLIGLGPRGIHTRVLAARLRNRWTYAGNAVAPGQMTLAEMLGDYRVRRIRPDADLYAVVGKPIAHSLSPAMHNAGFDHFGLNAAYVALEAADEDDFVAFARAMNLRGASVTAPFKVGMLSRVDLTDRVADEVGALNTIRITQGRWVGSNTDVAGFLAPLKGRLALRGTRVAILGAGGAARAVAVALKREGARVTICARKIGQARAVASAAGVHAALWPPVAGSWDVLVNATSCGTHPGDPSPMAGQPLAGEIVFDLIYSPPETPLLAQARAAGCLTIGGIEMLIGQAERQFETWTRRTPPPGLFRRAADAARAHPSGAGA